MAKRTNLIVVKDTTIKTMKVGNTEYVCITDIARQKNEQDTNGVMQTRKRKVTFVTMQVSMNSSVSRIWRI